MLEFQNLSKRYPGPAGTVRAVEEISLTVSAGQFVAVQGPSGCGKTTLLLMAGGLQRPDAGQVLLEGQNPYSLSPEARAALRARAIGFVFQQFYLVPYLNVLDNVLTPSLAWDVPQAKERALELIDRFQLSARVRHVPAELSTGERQRTALARAMLARPQLLLADEPTGNLDSANADIVLRSMADFAKTGGCVLLVTHDERIAKSADRIVRLHQGRMVSQN
jgi:putative ABC transport system ATP-binding protein